LRMNLHEVPLAPEVDLAEVARSLGGYTGSDIVGIASSCRRAGFRREISGQPDTLVMPSDVEESLARIPPSVTPPLMKRYEAFNERRF